MTTMLYPGAHPRRSRPWTAASTWMVFLCLAFFATACDSGGSDDDVSPEENGGGEAPSLFAIQTTVEAPDGRTSFVQLKEDLNFDELSIDEAMELPGNARVFLSEYHDTEIFVGAGQSAEIQQYAVSEGGTLTPGATVSFVNFGLGFIPFGHNFVSEDKAYLVDAEGGQILVWDPSSMEVRGEIPLDDPRLQKGYTTYIDPGVVRDDGFAFFLVQQHDFGDLSPDGVFAGTQVLVVNTATDAIEDVIEDTRCVSGLSGLTQAADGTIYVMGDNYFVRRVADPALPGSCVLRILPGELAFDDDYRLEMSAVVGSEDCGGLHALSDTRALTTCWDPSDASVDLTDDPFALFSEQIATWYVIDLVEGSAPIALTELGLVGSSAAHTIDGNAYVSVGEGREGENQLYELTADGTVTPLFTTQGLVTNLGRVEPE